MLDVYLVEYVTGWFQEEEEMKILLKTNTISNETSFHFSHYVVGNSKKLLEVT